MSEQHPNNLQQLLKVCIETSRSSTNNNESSQLDSNTQQWLRGALDSVTSSVIEEMLKCIEELKNGMSEINAGTATEETYSKMKSSLNALVDYTGSIDYAQDFHKIGGFEILSPLLSVSNSDLRSSTADLIGELVQNNPYCQKETISMGFLKILLEKLENDTDETVRVKCLYAISCLVRQNTEAQIQLEKEDGFSVLLRTMQQPTDKLKVKSAFLLMNLCNQNPKFGEMMFNMGFVEQLVALIHREHTASHEYLIGALLALVTHNEQCQKECQRSDLRLQELLENRVKELENKEEFREELEYCQKILNLCFYQLKQDTPEFER